MQLIFVHGWGTTNTDTYGGLPDALSAAAADAGLDLAIGHIHLGRYISFHDEVTLDDIARALDRALRELPGNGQAIQPFSCITHSTGGPVVRHWINRFLRKKGDGFILKPLSQIMHGKDDHFLSFVNRKSLPWAVL